MSQEHLSYEERNRQREERIIQHERELNESRIKARRAKQVEDTEAPLQAAKAFKRRRMVAIIFLVLTVIAFVMALLKKSPVRTPAAPPETTGFDN